MIQTFKTTEKKTYFLVQIPQTSIYLELNLLELTIFFQSVKSTLILIWLHAIGNIKRFWHTNVTFTSKISWWASSIILFSVSVWRPPFTGITSVTWSAPASPPIRRFTLSILWISPSRRRTVPLYGLTASGFLFRWTSLFLALLQWARARPNWWSFQISTPFLTGTFPWWWTLFLFFTLNTRFVLFLQGDICNLQEK